MADENRPMRMTVEDLASGSTTYGVGRLVPLFFKGVEGISQVYSYNVSFIVMPGTDFSFDKVLGQKITISLERDQQTFHYFRGICNTLSEGVSFSGFRHYHATVVSPMWMLTRRARSRVFHDQAIPDIAEKELQTLCHQAHFSYIKVAASDYPKHDYCTQYRESDFNFVCRLMEEEGMYYFFEHEESGSTMMVVDPLGAKGNLPKVGFDIAFGPGASAGLSDKPNRIDSWEKMQQVRSNSVTLIDQQMEHQQPVYTSTQNLTSPTVQVGQVSHKLKVLPDDYCIADFPGEFCHRFDDISMSGGSSSDGIGNIDSDKDRTTKIRIEQHAASSIYIHGTSTVGAFASGKRFTINDKTAPDANGEYLLISVTHSISQSAPLPGSNIGGNTHYSNSFTAIPFSESLPYRAPRRVPRPNISGTQTAIVVGLPNDKTQEIVTDKFGRVKVKFPWNPSDPQGQDSSRWIRVGQMFAGNRWGSSFWPRVGQEVIVSFLEGDPDQPIIVGSVYNELQRPPYLGGDGFDSKHKNNNQISGIKTNSTLGGKGYNELRFDDTKGSEQVFIHAEHNYDQRIKNESRTNVGSNTHLTVGGMDQNGNKAGDLREHVFQDHHVTIERDRIENVKGNMQLLIGGGDGDVGTLEVVTQKDLKELVQGNQHLHVNTNRNEKIDMNQSLNVGMNQDEKVGMNHSMEAGMAIHIKAGMTMVLEAGVELSLKVGGNFIDINPAGVFITGTLVMINSGGAAGSGTDASPQAPDDAQQANPTLPDDADDSASGNKSLPSS